MSLRQGYGPQDRGPPLQDNAVKLSIFYAEKDRQKKGGHGDPPLH